jgi:hypothetical protein
MRIILSIVFIALGFLSNILGILINPVTMLIAIPFALFLSNIPYRWGFLLFLAYYIGLFEIGPFLLSINENEIPILISTKFSSVAIFTLGSYIPYSLIVLGIKRYPAFPKLK